MSKTAVDDKVGDEVVAPNGIDRVVFGQALNNQLLRPPSDVRRHHPGALVSRLNRAAGAEINLAPGAAGFDKQPINCGGLESVRPGVADRRFHAGNALPVKKSLAWRSVGVCEEMPQGWHKFVGFISTEGDDFDRSEPVLTVEQK